MIYHITNGIINGSCIAIASLGFALVYQTSRIFHIAYAALYTLAGYAFFYFFQVIEFSFVASLLLSIGVTSSLSLACEVFVYQPLVQRGMGSHSLMVASIGLMIILGNLVVLIFGNSPRLVDAMGLIHFSLAALHANRMLLLFLNVAILLVMLMVLKRTRFGVITRSMRDDVMLGRVLGINDRRYRAYLFLISGALLAFIASFQALDVGVNPDVGLPLFINAFIAMIIGGNGRFEGPVLGGFSLGIIQSLTEYFTQSQWINMVVFVILFAFLVFKPEGLLPERRRQL